MKKTLLLTLALGLAGASSLTAANVDIYLTGSTAFRQNCYEAAKKLYVGANPSIYYGNAANGGANSGFSSSTASWCMTGTPITGLTNLAGSTLVIHGLFTGSVQGVQTVEQNIPLVFPTPAGTAGGLTSAYVTNTATIGFSDASSSVTPFPATGNYVEESVAVLPFVFCKSSGTSSAMTNITGVTWEQAEYGIPAGRIPLSAWTYKTNDLSTFIYLVQRTSDSGTRRVETAQMYYQFNDPVGVYIYDFTNDFYYTPTVLAATPNGTSPNGVVGPAGLDNANLAWGYGYVGGGDVRTALGKVAPNNNAIGYLSYSDAKSLGSSNWANVLPFNGVWPTSFGPGVRGNTSTNDNFAPITSGYYPCWGNLVLIHPIDPSLIPGQNVTTFQLGDQFTPGSFLGVFNAQTLYNAGNPLVGSIENEIDLSKGVPNSGGCHGHPLERNEIQPRASRRDHLSVLKSPCKTNNRCRVVCTGCFFWGGGATDRRECKNHPALRPGRNDVCGALEPIVTESSPA
ncbi:MAG: hypothetical protein WDM80_02140 [Limisphaerales bacterium]